MALVLVLKQFGNGGYGVCRGVARIGGRGSNFSEEKKSLEDQALFRNLDLQKSKR